MVWIATVPEAEATGLVKRFYEGSRDKKGLVSESLKAYSLSEHHMRAANTLRVSAVADPSNLSGVLRQTIAVRVSTLNGCDY